MKYRVNVKGKKFEVEVYDIFSQPIIAYVDGDPVEVWVEKQYNPPGGHSPSQEISVKESTGASLKISTGKPGEKEHISFKSESKMVHSPIPGVITRIAVKEGDEISKGQELCILEAMKMKNAIRSPRNGVIARVHVVLGQTVQHHDTLLEFAD